jgi:hypothetical protein
MDKIYISLSTIPSRFKNIKKTIISLQNQTIKPFQIILNIPLKYKRFHNSISDKDIKRLQKKCPSLYIHRTKNDYGPGTKLMGALEMIDSDSYILLVDDDIIYHPKTLETFISFTLNGCASSMSIYHLHYELLHPLGFDIGQGWNGFFIPSKIKDDIFRFYDIIKDEERVFFDDDVWISYYLNKKGVKIMKVKELTHQEHNHIDALKFINWFQCLERGIDLFYTRLCIKNIYHLDKKGAFNFIKESSLSHYYYGFFLLKMFIYLLL